MVREGRPFRAAGGRRHRHVARIGGDQDVVEGLRRQLRRIRGRWVEYLDARQDRLMLDLAMFDTAPPDSRGAIADYAAVIGPDTVLDFGDGNIITLSDFTNLSDLEAALIIG